MMIEQKEGIERNIFKGVVMVNGRISELKKRLKVQCGITTKRQKYTEQLLNQNQ